MKSVGESVAATLTGDLVVDINQPEGLVSSDYINNHG
jgi:hypothetical protein